ncbi:MAG TPA: hypothetical protein VM427_02000 [Patescibacteria group bacterium]|nr:hypothetical protein [Patescibacteria group bacterium]
MSKKRRGYARHQPAPAPRRPWRVLLVGGMAVAAVGVIALAVALNPGSRGAVGGVTAWSTLGTPDVHSLAFDAADPQHLYFGHHGGLLETKNGGRTWQGTALRGADAMNVAPTASGFFQIAGHNVYMETADGGKTWQDVPNDLPGLDLHAFVADPADPSHAWAFSVGNGLFETTDKGRTWELRQAGGWGALTSFVASGKTVLLAIRATGLSRSDDGGRTWTALGLPAGQVASLAAAADGTVLYAGTTQGISRSTDGGRTWASTPLKAAGLTVAVHPKDSNLVAVVDDETRFFRSKDGGASWPGP